MNYEQNQRRRNQWLKPHQLEDNVRYFGMFMCKTCTHGWSSGNTWKDMFQKCKLCNGRVYAYRQVIYIAYMYKVQSWGFCSKM